MWEKKRYFEKQKKSWVRLAGWDQWDHPSNDGTDWLIGRGDPWDWRSLGPPPKCKDSLFSIMGLAILLSFLTIFLLFSKISRASIEKIWENFRKWGHISNKSSYFPTSIPYLQLPPHLLTFSRKCHSLLAINMGPRILLHTLILGEPTTVLEKNRKGGLDGGLMCGSEPKSWFVPSGILCNSTQDIDEQKE